MSQDLLAEFGDFSIGNNHQDGAFSGSSAVSAAPIIHTVHPGTLQPNQLAGSTESGTGEDAWAEGEDDDDFGDFEAPEADAGQDFFSQPSSLPPKVEPQKFTPPAPVAAPPKTPLPPKQEAPSFIRSDPVRTSQRTQPVSRPEAPTVKQPVAMSKPAFKPKPKYVPKPKESTKPGKALSSSHPFADMADILFDAEFSDEEDMFEVEVPAPVEEDDDDFGGFEAVTPEVVSTSRPSASQQKQVSVSQVQSATFDLLGFDEPPPSQPRPANLSEQTKPAAASKPAPSRKAAPQSHPPALRSQNIIAEADDDFAEWDDFESVPTKPSKTTSPPPQPDTTTLISLPHELIGSLLSAAPNTPSPPPSNIPPPSLLFPLFPPLLTATSTTFLHPLSTLPATQKTSFLHSPQTQSFLQNYLTATHVLAHMIAGRKNRWKRDKFLAQSMRIGPSVSGRSGGMKLAGLDSNEARREEAEVEDVLKIWREQVGRLRTAVTAAAGASASGGLPVVPEMASTMPIRVAKQAEGGVVSTGSCALCGLKREERVVKVDVGVEDSFGEWWVEGTNMHVACWTFWGVHKDRLKGR